MFHLPLGLLGRINLEARTIAVLLIFILLGGVFGVMLSLDTLKSAYASYFNLSMRRMAIQMCASVQESLISEDFATSKGILKSIAIGQEIHAIYLDNVRGDRFYVRGDPAPSKHPAWFGYLLTTPALYPQRADLVVGGRNYGSCWVLPSHSAFLNVAWDDFLRQSLVWATTGVLLIVVIVLILRSGLAPLRRMVEAVRDNATAPSADVTDPPEIRQAIMVLNQLSDAHGDADRSVVDAALSQLSQYQEAINAAAIVIETDAPGKIFFVNAAFSRIRCAQSFNPRARLFSEIFAGCPEGAFLVSSPWSAELSFAFEGDISWVTASAYPIIEKTGQIVKWIVIANDITTRKRLELDLLRSMEERSLLLSEMAHAIEDERKRIARELHDEMGQRLVSLMMDADIATHFIPTAAEEGSASLKRLRENLLSTYKLVNRMIDEMRPPLLETLGFDGAIHALVDECRTRMHWINFAVSTSGSCCCSNAAQVAVFRIVQEALTNIAKHARTAKNVRIEISCVNDNDVQFFIKDDGIGFTENASEGLGLATMRDRAISLGGTFNVMSAHGSGTCILATMPAARPKPAP